MLSFDKLLIWSFHFKLNIQRWLNEIRLLSQNMSQFNILTGIQGLSYGSEEDRNKHVASICSLLEFSDSPHLIPFNSYSNQLRHNRDQMHKIVKSLFPILLLKCYSNGFLNSKSLCLCDVLSLLAYLLLLEVTRKQLITK